MNLGGIAMAHQITVNDQDFAAIVAEAEKNGTQVEDELHEMIRLYLFPQTPLPMTLREFAEKQYREGKLTHLPTGGGVHATRDA
jgi:hypothetical protein